uniref:Uncharacterized protein n=1 Tax=Globodera rostochiensis TaxID=31243 RepID=A0A914GVZ2_GLORO
MFAAPKFDISVGVEHVEYRQPSLLRRKRPDANGQTQTALRRKRPDANGQTQLARRKRPASSLITGLVPPFGIALCGIFVYWKFMY